MKKLPSFLNCSTSLVGAFLLTIVDLGSAQAEPVAINPTPEPVAERRNQLIETLGNGADTLGNVTKPIYDLGDFVTPISQTLDELIQDSGKSEFVKPAYTTDIFSPKAIAQAKKPEPAKPANDDTEELEEVQVKTDRILTPDRRETSPTYRINKADITATGESTVSGVLRKLAPGFSSIDSLGGINTDQGVFLRGLGSNRFLVLIDGRPTTRPSNNRSADLGRLGVSNIERIEVITGAAVLRYGAGAIAGAINIITRAPDAEKLVLTAEGGSYGFSRQTVNYTNTNGLKLGTPGYIGYEINYERRSVLNNYIGTAVEQPAGQGIVFNQFPDGSSASNPGAAIIPPNTPTFVLRTTTGGEDVTFYQGPISYKKILNGAYAFSDDYTAKIIYQPAIDHILRASISVRDTRTGDQFANLNFGSCIVTPKGYGFSPELALGPLNPTDLQFYTYTNCTAIPSVEGQRRAGNGKGDNAEDNITASLGWEWKLTDVNKLNFLGSFSSSFETNPSNLGTRIASSQIIDVQLNYSSELAKNNTFNAGFEYFQQRYNATPQVGSGGNQSFPSRDVGVINNFFAVDITKSSLAFYATDQWRFFDDALIIDLNARWTNDQFFGTFTTPGAGLRWSFGGPKGQEPLAFRASWFQSFRAPGLAEIYGYSAFNVSQTETASGNILRNLALKQETGTSYDLGLDIRISPSSLFRITYYRTDLTNAIVGNVQIETLPLLAARSGGARNYTPEQEKLLKFNSCIGLGTQLPSPIINGQSTCVPPLLTNINAQSYLSTGWEFAYNWQVVPQLEFSASYSLVDSRPVGDAIQNSITDTDTGVNVPLGSGGVAGGFFYGYQPADIPFSTANVGLRYASNGYRFALNALFIGLRPRAQGGNNYYLPYSRWDFTFGIPLTDELTFTGGVFNIFNDQSVLADTGLGIGGGVLLAPTTFRAGIEATFVTK
jgi:iron complex outermembrane recepter protein